MRGAKSGFSNSRNQKCGQVTFFGVDIHVIITYIYVCYIYTSVLVRSFTLLVDRELVNHNWEEGVWLCVCNICNDI